jgi:hypothetical protein
MDIRETLQRQKDYAQEGIDFAYQNAEFWKKIYYGSRASLIVFSVLTSA